MSALASNTSARSYAPVTAPQRPYQAKIYFNELKHPDNAILWKLVDGNSTLHAKSETGITEFVVNMMREIIGSIITSFNQFKNHRLSLEFGPTNAKEKVPDVWIVRAGHTPIFVIEVKRPGIFRPKRTDDCKLIHEQMYANLLTLFFEGVEAPFGIISTYEQTQICWLEDDAEGNKKLAASTKIYHVRNYREKITAIADSL